MADGDLARQGRALGLDAAALARLVGPRREPPRFRVWPENWDALRLFLALATQWRRAGLAGAPTGLDYAVLPVVSRALALTLDGPLLARLQVIETAWLSAAAAHR